MGFLEWATLSALALVAGFALALRWGTRFSVGEVAVGAMVTALALIVGAIQLLGYTDALYPQRLAALVAVSSLALLALSRAWRLDWRALGARLVHGARSVFAPEILAPGTAALLLITFLAAAVYLMPSWAWDAVWYHNPISAYAYQDHSLHWYASHVPFLNSYPKNVELLGLWNVIFVGDDRFLDAVQLPLSLMGVLTIATLARRSGARPPMAAGLGLCWLLLPAVYLNIPSNYVDTSCAALWLAAVLFLARVDATGAHRFFGALALGIYLGAKVTGALHAALIAPVVVLVLLVQLVREPHHRFRRLLAATTVPVLILALGIWTYARNWVRFRNPVWPAHMKIGGLNFPGTWELNQFNTPPWGGPDNLAAQWRSWTTSEPNYIVDVRLGGFGPMWPYLLLPLCVVALLLSGWRLLRGQKATGMLAILVLIGTALVTPAAWWCRYTLGLPAAGLLAAGMVFSALPQAWMSRSAMALVGVLAVVQAWPGRAGFYLPLSTVAGAVRQSPRERAFTHLAPWQPPQMEQRDLILQPGDAAVYDDSASFVYQLWRYDWANRVLYRPLSGNPDAWRQAIENEGARWAAIRRDSRAANALKAAGWQYMGDCGSEPCGIWARPRDGS